MVSRPPAPPRGRRPAPLLWLSWLPILLLVGCAGLPSLEGRTPSRALSAEEAADTPLGALTGPLVRAHPGRSGVHLLADPHDAFAARLRLADAARQTLDVQYYIWRPDTTGKLLFDALRRAADRGVRVRLLLDDYNTAGMDPVLAALNAHDNIEVRLFNPFVTRGPRFWDLLTDLPRVNRRMHNKTFIADNSLLVLGGRNVADEYFGATETLFSDLDVLVMGPVVASVSDAFDRYWRSDSAYPAERILRADQNGEPPPEAEGDSRADYLEELGDRDPVVALRDGKLALCWATTRLVVDDPAKGLGEAEGAELFLTQLDRAVGDPEQRLDIIASYFIPTRQGVEDLTGLAARGVQVRVLTNSMAATDVALVHSGYAKWRRDLLEGGVQLYEMKRGDGPRDSPHLRAGPYGSARSTLHAKAFAVDGEQLVVGSFNADPRSANLNTELGLVIDCPWLADNIHGAFPDKVMKHAYRVRLDDNGKLYWLSVKDGETVRFDREPDTTLWQRLSLPVFSILPIDGLL